MVKKYTTPNVFNGTAYAAADEYNPVELTGAVKYHASLCNLPADIPATGCLTVHKCPDSYITSPASLLHSTSGLDTGKLPDRTFSIKQMEEFCEIKAHTLRTWENRYGLLVPSRTNTTTRSYSVEHLKLGLKISLLYHNGYKIASLARMNKAEVQFYVNKLSDVSAQQEKAICYLIPCMYQMEIDEFEAILDNCFRSLPAIDVIQHIIYPFLQKVNLLFRGKQLTEEHLVVTVIRKKIIYCIEKMEKKHNTGKKVLLFLCGEHQLDLFLLYAACMLKDQGYTVINLGVDISVSNLSDVIRMHQPEYLLTYCSKKQAAISRMLSTAVEGQNCILKAFMVQAERSESTGSAPGKVAEVYYEDLWSILEEYSAFYQTDVPKIPAGSGSGKLAI